MLHLQRASLSALLLLISSRPGHSASDLALSLRPAPYQSARPASAWAWSSPRRPTGEAPPYCCQDDWVGGSPAVTWLDPGEPDARRHWRRYISARDLTTLAATCDPTYLASSACIARAPHAWTDLSLTSRAGGRRGPAIPIRSAAFSIGLSYAMKLLAFARGGLGWVGELGRTTVTAVSCICGVPARWW